MLIDKWKWEIDSRDERRKTYRLLRIFITYPAPPIPLQTPRAALYLHPLCRGLIVSSALYLSLSLSFRFLSFPSLNNSRIFAHFCVISVFRARSHFIRHGATLQSSFKWEKIKSMRKTIIRRSVQERCHTTFLFTFLSSCLRLSLTFFSISHYVSVTRLSLIGQMN